MNRYKITLNDLKDHSNYLLKGDCHFLVSFLNEFRGNNIFEKFINILNSWETDVSYTLNFNFDNKTSKIQLSYIINEIQKFKDITSDFIIKEKDVEIKLGIPDFFENNIEIIPIYGIVKSIKISGMIMDFTKLGYSDRKEIIDSLPANIFNMILNSILHDNSRVISFDNTILNDFKLNLLTNDIFQFIKGLFSSYDEKYFRDVIYYLSQKINGDILLHSTLLDVEYYMEKYSEEMKNQNNQN